MRERLVNHFPLINDVCHEYGKYRRRGKNRQGAIEEILNLFSSELADVDDGPQVWIGLAKVTGSKGELTTELLKEAASAFDQLVTSFPEMENDIISAKTNICDTSHIGPEARYPQRRIYKPDWQIGDTFLYHLNGDYPKQFGLDGWYAVIRKIGEYTDEDDRWQQLVYLSLCPPDGVPQTSKEVENLGYLPFAKQSDGYEYRGEINIRNSKEHVHELTKIGTFKDVPPPEDEVFRRGPIQGWLLSTKRRKGVPNSLEMYVCLNYKKYGLIRFPYSD